MSQISRELLEQLAPYLPMTHEMGSCIWCDHTPPRFNSGYAERKASHHTDDCPWMKARRLLGDEIK